MMGIYHGFIIFLDEHASRGSKPEPPNRTVTVVPLAVGLANVLSYHINRNVWVC
jgi:hypothetical protein